MLHAFRGARFAYRVCAELLMYSRYLLLSRGAGPDPDPHPRIRTCDVDPALFVSDLQDTNKNIFFFSLFYAYSLLRVHFFHHSSKIKKS